MLRPVSAFLAVVLHHVDSLLLHLTNNRYTATEVVGLPVLQLITIGAKTGKQRKTILVRLQDGEKIALIASNYGRAPNPSWYYNLKANPECQVLTNERSATYIAYEAEGEEREKYWQLALFYYAGYEKYRARAVHRRIPVMVLKPKI
jgi:deazaflavin-dependent oxidoreductase (nitroreductase family)